MNPQINNNINNNIPQLNMDNNNNNINNNNPQNNGSPNHIVLTIIIFIVIIISFYNIYNFVYIVNLIKRAYNILPNKVFEECYLYPRYLDLFLEFISFFLGIDLIFLTAIPLVDYTFNLDIFFMKFSGIFLYFNYIVFGPFLIGCLFLSLKHKAKLMYICVNYNPEKKIVNFRIFFIFIFNLIISSIISFFGSWYFSNNYFNNSIKCKPTGNYIIGKIFWDIALRRSRRFRNELNLNNVNLNEGILDNQDENQNLI